MFETRPEFEQAIPAFFAKEGSRYWQAMAISVDLPWYLLRYRQASDEGCFTQTLAVAWESGLRSLIGGSGIDLIDLSIVALDGGSGGWTMRRVSEVWSASEDEAQETGPLLFLLAAETSLLSSHLQQVQRTCPDRTLLVRIR